MIVVRKAVNDVSKVGKCSNAKRYKKVRENKKFEN